MTPVQLAQLALDHSDLSPYAPMLSPLDAAERAALAVCTDLCGRASIRRVLEEVETKTRLEIVATMAAIIRIAMRPAGMVGTGESVLGVDGKKEARFIKLEQVDLLVEGVEARLAANISAGTGPLARALARTFAPRREPE